MSLRKNVPFAPWIEPAAGMMICGAPPIGITRLLLWICAAKRSARSGIIIIFTMRTTYTAALTLLLAFAASGATVIRADRVLDGRGHSFANAAVVVDGTKIVRIDEHPSHVDYDLKGMTLLPGGIDTHVHIAWHFDADGR